MGVTNYICTLTIVAVIWVGFFIWIVTSAATHYVDKVMKQQTLIPQSSQVDEINKNIQLDLSISRFRDYENLFPTESGDSLPFSAKIDQYNPMDTDDIYQFSSPSWRIDSMGVEETLRSNYFQSDMHEKIEMLVQESDGFTKMIENEHYAILTNVCINAKNRVLTIHLKDPSVIGTVKSKYNRNDFYFNDVRVLRTPLNPTKVIDPPLNLAILHPQSTSNAGFLEGTSLLTLLSLHPELFPHIDSLLLLYDSSKLNSFQHFLFSTFVRSFPTDSQPTVYFGNEPLFQQKELVCDRIVTVLRDWQEEGIGAYFPAPLAVNQIRAQAYKYAHVYPDAREATKRTLLALRRKSVRVIENFDSMLFTIQSSFPMIQSEALYVPDIILSELITVLSRTDILISVYSSELLYTLFMIPDRVVIEIFPPFWDEHEYGQYVDNVGLVRILFRTNGEIAKACKKRPNSRDCKIKGTRDRNFTVSLHDTKVHVYHALQYLQSDV